MRQIRLGLAAVILTVALIAGCASSGTTTAQAPVTTTATTPTGAASPSSSPSPVTTSATTQALPDGYDATRNAKADINAALAAAAKDNREMLIDFGANWCPDCMALDVMFRSVQVEPLLQKDYLVVAVDVGSSTTISTLPANTSISRPAGFRPWSS